MSAFSSVNPTFAVALAAQAEIAATRFDGGSSEVAAARPVIAGLIATLDPSRAAVASALLRIDVAKAPQVAGPYVPGGASGPLTEDDIFDPSKLYSLPGQEVVIFDGATEATAASLATSVRPGSANSFAPGTSHDLGYGVGANLNGSLDEGAGGEAGHPALAALRETLDLQPGSKPATGTGAGSIDVHASTLTLELAVAGYMSLLKAGLSPTKRKILRGLKGRAAPAFDDRARSGADNWDHGEGAPTRGW